MGNESKTRENHQKQAREYNKKTKKRKIKMRKRIRLIPIWVKVVVVLLLFSASLIGGAMVGYGVIGDGEPKEVLSKKPWLKIHEIIYKEFDE